ncbi:MAG: ATP-binding protein [Sulfuricurvum sp.]|jgi:signal transduction histidine kinase/DNA-binding response OmpR family regulator
MMNVPNLFVLQQAVAELVAAKEEILSEWVHEKLCADILQRHDIDMELFYGYFASNIFDYFIGVVSGKVELGKCPVMAELIEYLKNKEIRSEELFILCTHLKRSVINATYASETHSQALFEAISYLFDRNFAGVLELYTDTIYQKEQEAIEAGHAKEYFLSNMSHEIRTPLNAILGFVTLLKDEAISERHQHYLDIIANSGENLLHIINDILDFSKIRSGEFIIDPHVFNLRTEISNTLELYNPSAQLKGITVMCTMEENLPQHVLADSFRMKQILGNFLSNAIKFSSHNQMIKVDVLLQESMLGLAVQDYGSGIESENQQRIFDPFYQAIEGRKISCGGSGLGLSICKQLAAQMGGNITLESNSGEGSRFVVYLPVELTSEISADVRVFSSEIRTYEGKILIAEDNEANQELLKMILHRYGLECTVSNNGLEAYEKAIVNKYDLILMDEQMPFMIGHEATSRIREHEKQHDLDAVPIVAVSANVVMGARERALNTGYNDFIGKPIIHQEIENILERYLQPCSSPVSKAKPSVSKSAEIQRLKQALMLEDDQIQQLLELFYKKMDEMLPQLQEAILDCNCERIAHIAHTIKGSSGNFRYEELSTLAAIIEKSAREERLEFDFNEVFVRFERMYCDLYSSR